MRKKEKNITNNLLRKLLFLKKEFNNLTKRSIKKNQLITPSVIVHIGTTIIRGKDYISKQTNTCIITGRRGAFYKKHQLSRHALMKFSNFGNLQNLKVASW